ncbi:MAG: hypothetical protein H6744_19300 [Deltaproteobacteria bacterium]|nr:hypothetical protein [Deltaproteobacteria bacterium]
MAVADLDAERRLLDAARASLAGGAAGDALVSVRAHGRRFPGGLLVEEREQLRVRATAALGRAEEAARLRDAFLARWPRSVYRPALEAVGAPRAQ